MGSRRGEAWAAWIAAVCAVISVVFAWRACRSADRAEDAAAKRDRARLSITTIDLMAAADQPAAQIEPGREHHLRIKFTNRGALSAHQVSANGTWGTSTSPCPAQAARAAMPLKIEGVPSDAVLGPGESGILNVLIEKLDEPTVDKIRTGQMALFVRGVIAFQAEDAPKPGEGDHSLKFCLVSPREGRTWAIAFSNED